MIRENQHHLVRGWREALSEVGGTGTASVLGMTDAERDEARRREQNRLPFGFSVSPTEASPRRRGLMRFER